MTEPAAISHPQATHFIRHTLGCGCPDEVFEHIRIDMLPEVFIGLPVDYMIDVGGRLLVAVCASADWRQVQQSLTGIVRRAREYRDRNGFNRLATCLSFLPSWNSTSNALRDEGTSHRATLWGYNSFRRAVASERKPILSDKGTLASLS